MGARLKKGDTVCVISGSEQGKKGKILKISDKGILVEKVNIARKHQKPSKNFQGGIIEKLKPVGASKLVLICPKCNEGVKVRIDRSSGMPARKCASCSEIIDKVK